MSLMLAIFLAILPGSYQWFAVTTDDSSVAMASLDASTYAALKTNTTNAHYLILKRQFVDIVAIDPTAPIKVEVYQSVTTAHSRYDSLASLDKGIVSVATGEFLVWYSNP